MDTDTARSWLLALGNAVDQLHSLLAWRWWKTSKTFPTSTSETTVVIGRAASLRPLRPDHPDRLHCIQAAKSGGESSIVSVQAIVEKMQCDYPDLAEALFEPMPYWQVEGSRGVQQAGPAPDRRPVLANGKNGVSCMLYRPFIEQAAEALGEPLSAETMAALDCFETISRDEELSLKFPLVPGECMFLHNRRVLHARTDYEDWPEREKRRHLLRIWLDASDEFPAAPVHEIGPLFGTQAS